MGQLLRFEMRKLFRQTSFYVCLILAVVLTFLGVYTLYSTYKLFMQDLPPGTAHIAETMGGAVLSGKGMMLSAFSNGNTTLLLAIFIALFICGDYKWKTAKNIIGRGFNRNSWLTARLGAVILGSLLIGLVTLGTGYLSGSLFWKAGEAIGGKDISLLALQLLILLAYAAMFFFFSVLTRNQAGSIALGVLLPILLVLILTVIDLTVFKQEETLSRYWLGHCLNTVTGIHPSSGDLTRCWLLGGGYLILFTGLSYLVNAKRDV